MTLKNTTIQQAIPAHQKQPATLPAIRFTRAPLTSAHTLFRSRILTTDIDVNPLIAAAAAIFPLLHMLTETTSYDNLNDLQQMLIHEIKAFEIRAQSMACHTDKILLARFILCSVVDEMIQTTSWGKTAWDPYKLLIVFHHEAWGGEHFFLVLERLSENIDQNIEVLELLYICFSVGYQGKFRLQNKGQEELALLINELYQKIKWKRGELRKNLLINDAGVTDQEQIPETALPQWAIITFFIAIIITVYMSFNYLLAQQANIIYQQLNNILNLPY